MDPEDAARYDKYWNDAAKKQGLSNQDYYNSVEDAFYNDRKAQGYYNGFDYSGFEGTGKRYNITDFTKEMDNLPHAKISQEMKETVSKLPKGEKPNPSMYMSSSEITEHLSLFDDGAVRIQSKESFEKAIQSYGSNIGDPATGTFVLPKSVVDKAIDASNGNPRVLEELLGLDSGYLGNNPILVDIIELSNIRIPSGNEAGAWPDYWMPGGFTSGGVPEAVVDQIPAGGYNISNVYSNSAN